MNSYPISRKTNIVVQEFETEVLIYDLTINKAFCLNETSAMIWQLCDGTKTISQISEIVSRKLKTPFSDDLIWLALDQFKRDNLLEKSDELQIEFGGLNRRQVIKKVGLASMVMLPIISSIIAPTSAMSASLLGTCQGPCTTDADCAPPNLCKQDITNGINRCGIGSFRNNSLGTNLGIASDQNFCNGQAVSRCCSGSGTKVGSDCFCT